MSCKHSWEVSSEDLLEGRRREVTQGRSARFCVCQAAASGRSVWRRLQGCDLGCMIRNTRNIRWQRLATYPCNLGSLWRLGFSGGCRFNTHAAILLYRYVPSDIKRLTGKLQGPLCTSSAALPWSLSN